MSYKYLIGVYTYLMATLESVFWSFVDNVVISKLGVKYSFLYSYFNAPWLNSSMIIRKSPQ